MLGDDSLSELAAPQGSEGRSKRVFIVNGSHPFLELLDEFLTVESYDVVVSFTLSVTFEQILAFDPDVLIIDIIAFDNHGWELLEQIHSSASMNQVPVIIISTSPDVIDQAKAQVERYGGDYYLAKPLDLEELLSKVNQATRSTCSSREQLAPERDSSGTAPRLRP